MKVPIYPAIFESWKSVEKAKLIAISDSPNNSMAKKTDPAESSNDLMKKLGSFDFTFKGT